MRIWSKRASDPRPGSCVGLWLRALLLDQRELRDQLRVTLNGGEAGWNYDEPAVVEAVCLVALRRLFPAGPGLNTAPPQPRYQNPGRSAPPRDGQPPARWQRPQP
jgi:hypothetical protein